MNPAPDWREALAALAPAYARRAAELDESDEFVAQNIAELKASGLLGAAVPAELGGQGLLALSDLCEMLQHADWVASSSGAQPEPATTNKSMISRTLVARGVLATVDAAMNVAGGAAFFRAHGLERLFRNAQGARYHPLQEGLQKALAARCALGLEI